MRSASTSRPARRYSAAPPVPATRGWRFEAALFAAAYLAYVASRWLFTGQPGPARANANWIWELERSTGIAVEASLQRAFSFGAAEWVLGNVYLAAQMAVLPAALILVYRRSWPVYRRLRSTVIATWMLSVPAFALFPVAPPRLADLGVDFADRSPIAAPSPSQARRPPSTTHSPRSPACTSASPSLSVSPDSQSAAAAGHGSSPLYGDRPSP